MRAAVLKNGKFQLEDIEQPKPKPGEVLLRVRACGVCRTDLHIVEGELPPHQPAIVPGHQIVGDMVDTGQRVGVSWLGGTDGSCPYCRMQRENLCDAPTFTGYDRDGGFAEYVTVREDFTYPLPPTLDDVHAAPLLCAGVIGYRALRVAGVQPGERVGLFGFGASAHLVLPVLQSWNCMVFVSTRGAMHRAFATQLGADWVGDALERPPNPLDRAITFAPAGSVVITALSSLRKGGVVAINAIHLDRMPEFDYDSLLWGEREIRSVTNMTRDDARDFLDLAAAIGMRPSSTTFPLEQIDDALRAVRSDLVNGAAVIVP